ncbi:FAD-binding-3 domain-containing protein [Mycena sanguinolenta]|uniref:FAD-binding-3 domain-containing protein n=1 Tax=Mycena sanguinolenta TaxID=230812 RepID=A0A8H7D8L3_9AGAR|nr:FAD-binding-3 domain-containing protein [Mycena sanguinolenta]
MSLPQQTTVLIVGAGPCGMAAALSLNHQGIHDIVIVDALLAGENSSRAMVIQAATLEVRRHYFVECVHSTTSTVSTAFLSVGNKVETLGLHDGPSYLLSTDFSLLSPYTKFPFALGIPQTKTEAGMLEKLDQLGIKVWRPFKVVSLKPSQDEGRSFEVRFESGDIIKARFAAKLELRSRIPMATNSTIMETFPSWPSATWHLPPPPQFAIPNQGVSITVSDGNFTLFARFPAKASPDKTRPVYRIACSVPVADGTAPHAPSAEYLQSLLDRVGPPALSSDPGINPHPTRIDHVYWSSRYRTRSAIADGYFAPTPNGTGAVLLIGDAAHIHSPIGGQGMSLGIRDAISLGPVLKAHIVESGANNKLFEDWASSRRQRALSVIALTKETMRIITAPQKIWSPFVTLGFAVLRFFGKFNFVKRMVAYRLSGLAEI